MLIPFLPMGRQGRPTQIGRIRRELALDRDGAVEILGAVRAIDELLRWNWAHHRKAIAA